MAFSEVIHYKRARASELHGVVLVCVMLLWKNPQSRITYKEQRLISYRSEVTKSEKERLPSDLGYLAMSSMGEGRRVTQCMWQRKDMRGGLFLVVGTQSCDTHPSP